jgi:hypothetical protein
VEHNLLLQAISTVDENGQAVTKGTKVSRGYYADNGPPTTLSGTGASKFERVFVSGCVGCCGRGVAPGHHQPLGTNPA